ncbi:hypothetical protein UFOVP353_16 [uncultured Caudovirales phage]|uniref:Uncharacterized protein n=1 Tax=uncultured Caudovirales phage TaxID=2100421 RepID=A0A6J5M7I9_9CAUD|nr:hypothetical protein UFOVP353_16 [uncultured Caudovirales phage]
MRPLSEIAREVAREAILKSILNGGSDVKN